MYTGNIDEQQTTNNNLFPTVPHTHPSSTDVLIAGGGVGGCAAALAVCRNGHNAILVEPTDWIGGQLTAQAVPPDEYGWIEQCGCTAGYREFRNGVRQYYRRHYPLTASAQAQPYLNPGNGWVSPLCHEPRVARAVIEAMLAPYRADGRLTLLLEHDLAAADSGPGDRVASVTLHDRVSGANRTITADYFLDATELGDLLPLAGVEFVTGSESRADTGEPGAPVEAKPANAQGFTICFAIDHLEGEDHTIDQPREYPFWRDYVPALTPPWPGEWISWTGMSPRTLEPVHYRFDPHREANEAFAGLWTYRRILARDHFEPGRFASDICLVNWPLCDYLLGDLCTCASEERARHIEGAKQLSLSVLHWMQTAAPRPDGGRGFPGLRLRPDVVGTVDGLAKQPYVREARRIRAEFTLCEQHVSADVRKGETRAERFGDSVGLGGYRIDLHPTCGGDNYRDVPVLPFQIPLGALIPVRVENLLPASKNLGVTHITNGCTRLHPTEWSIGEAAGALAAFCLQHDISPRGVSQHPSRLSDFQTALMQQGFELEWPPDLRLEDGDPHRHAMSQGG